MPSYDDKFANAHKVKLAARQTFEGPYDDEDAEEKARKKIDYEDRKSSQEGDDRRKGAYD